VLGDREMGRTGVYPPAELMRIDLKYRGMKVTGKIREISRASHGDYDPRVPNSPLQKLVAPMDMQAGTDTTR
jgi:hypothetical protein